MGEVTAEAPRTIEVSKIRGHTATVAVHTVWHEPAVPGKTYLPWSCNSELALNRTRLVCPEPLLPETGWVG